jgi:2-phospho-L-lactate guanylyltransferase
MIYRALIPVKRLEAAKSRLTSDLTQKQRMALVLRMLRHVIDVLHQNEVLESIAVVSPDPLVLAQAQDWGARTYVEERQGHNPALYAAAQQELATGATALLTISADLPLLQTQDIERMIALSQRYDVVLAPSREGTGTNALLVHPPLALPYLFGPGSLQLYQQEALRLHLNHVLYEHMSIALDIDTIDDLELLQRYQRRNAEEARCVACVTPIGNKE